MESCEKENFSLESEELKIRAGAEEKRKSVFRRLRKKTLVILGSLFFSASSLPAVSTTEIVEQFKSGDKIIELDKSKSGAEIRENIFEKQSDKEVIKKLCYVVKKIGAYAADQLGCLWKDVYDLENRPAAKKELIKKLNQKPRAEISETREPTIMPNLEQIGLNPDIVKEVLKTFPSSWLKEVSLITYLDRVNKTVVNEETGSTAELVAHHQSGKAEELSEIYFFPGAKTKRVDMLIFDLIWEYAHANNWKHRSDLTLAQRTLLLYEIIKRTESPDRFRHDFVELIQRNERETEIAKKMLEYWAMICMWVIAKPLDKSIPEADKKIVYSYLKLTDPEFDVVKAAELREDIIRGYREYLIKKGVIKEEEWILKDEEEKEEIKSDDLRDYSPYSNI